MQEFPTPRASLLLGFPGSQRAACSASKEQRLNGKGTKASPAELRTSAQGTKQSTGTTSLGPGRQEGPWPHSVAPRGSLALGQARLPLSQLVFMRTPGAKEGSLRPCTCLPVALGPVDISSRCSPGRAALLPADRVTDSGMWGCVNRRPQGALRTPRSPEAPLVCWDQLAILLVHQLGDLEGSLPDPQKT
ncbi:uncharacterized protein LOC144284474 [Canis aureus]